MTTRLDACRLDRCAVISALLGALVVLSAVPGEAQLTDLTQTPNAANAGINKSYEQQIGAGRADVHTPGSSLFIIKRDPFRSIRRGRQIFQRKFTMAQKLGPRKFDGDGTRPGEGIATELTIGAGLADSCAACHGRPQGSAGVGGDVFTRPDSRDAPHLFGLGLVEMLADEITGDLRAIRAEARDEAADRRRPVTKSLTSKGINFGRITARPDGSVDTAGVVGVDADLRVRPFFHHGEAFSIRQFVVGALLAEMGLEARDPDLQAAKNGHDTETPAGMVLRGEDKLETDFLDDEVDIEGRDNEVPTSVVDHLEFYLLNYFKPATYRQTSTTRAGREIMGTIGCTGCHVPDLLIERDRRVADVETVYDPVRGVFNRLFATATALVEEVHDGTGTLKLPKRQPFLVKNIFTDLKRHDLGPAFHERQFDGTLVTRFVTEPLWGVGSTGPYGHDGRSTNLREVILRHGGEAQAARNNFARLSSDGQAKVIAFLESLVLFPPDATASNLDPGDRSAAGFPQFGHGGISLTVLFNDPGDRE
jgi:hypothetical protein